MRGFEDFSPNFQLELKKSSPLLWFFFTTYCGDWSRKIAPLSQSIRFKTTTNREFSRSISSFYFGRGHFPSPPWTVVIAFIYLATLNLKLFATVPYDATQRYCMTSHKVVASERILLIDHRIWMVRVTYEIKSPYFQKASFWSCIT